MNRGREKWSFLYTIRLQTWERGVYNALGIWLKVYYLRNTYIKIGTIQRRLAWPLRKDDTQIREAFHIFIKQYFWVETRGVSRYANQHDFLFDLKRTVGIRKKCDPQKGWPQGDKRGAIVKGLLKNSETQTFKSIPPWVTEQQVNSTLGMISHFPWLLACWPGRRNTYPPFSRAADITDQTDPGKVILKVVAIGPLGPWNVWSQKDRGRQALLWKSQVGDPLLKEGVGLGNFFIWHGAHGLEVSPHHPA